MDKQKVNQLVNKMSNKCEQVSRVLENYKEGRVDYENLREEYTQLMAIKNNLVVELGGSLTELYDKIRKARQQKHEDISAKNVKTLGFQ